MAVLVGDGNMIQAGGSSIMDFCCFGDEFIGHMDGFGEVNGSIEGHRKYIAVVTGKSECTVGKRKSNSTVYNTKPIYHFGAHRHFYFTAAFRNRDDRNAKPFTKTIVVHHVVDYLLGCWIYIILH